MHVRILIAAAAVAAGVAGSACAQGTPQGTSPGGTSPGGTSPGGTSPGGTAQPGAAQQGATPQGTTQQGTTPSPTTPPQAPASGSSGHAGQTARPPQPAGTGTAAGSGGDDAAAKAAAEAARPLAVVSRHDGGWADALRTLALATYTHATGLAARLDVWAGGQDALRAGVKSGWDVVQLSAQELADACQEGLVDKLDWAQIGGRDHYVQGAANDCGVGASAHALLLSWDSDKVKGTPSWADFFDIARYPGKRALPKRARGVLEIALLADGVSPGDVYRTLRGNDGTDRAFRKLDQLRPYLDWWQTGSEATRILGSGAVLMVAAPNARVFAANHAEGRHFGTQWAGAVVSMDWWAIAHDSARARQAQQFLYLLGLPALEGRLLEETGAAGFAKGAADLLPPAAQAHSPLLPANLAAALVTDEGFWHDNGERLDGKFSAWLAH